MSADLLAKYKDVDPFLLKKWEKVFFVFFDRNASKDIDWADFYQVTRQVRDIYGADSEQMRYARETLKALWTGLCEIADINKDSLISLDEWVKLLKSGDKDKHCKWFDEYVHFLFKLFDVSDDKLMDLAEYTDGMVAYGYAQNECHQAFHKFSVDKKGNPVAAIDEKQFREYWQEYFYSTEATALGNYLFGMMT